MKPPPKASSWARKSPSSSPIIRRLWPLPGTSSSPLGIRIKQDDWQRTIELDPQSAAAWLGLAKTAHKLGDFERAVQCMQRLREVAADQADSQVFFQVDSLLKLGRPQEVVDCLEKLGESASLPAGARVTLGEAYYQLQQYERSSVFYRQALNDSEQASVAHYGLSMALMRLGRHDEAKQHRREYARLQQENMAIFDRMHAPGRTRSATIRGRCTRFWQVTTSKRPSCTRSAASGIEPPNTLGVPGRWRSIALNPSSFSSRFSRMGSDVQNSIFAADGPTTWKTVSPRKLNSVRLSPDRTTKTNRMTADSFFFDGGTP